MRLRKALSVVLATTLALTTPIQAFATDNVEIILPDKVNSSVQQPGAGKSDAILKYEAASFNVTLPTVLPITVTSDGTVITSDEVKLTNQSAGPVEIKSVEVISQNNWNLVEFGTDFSNSKVGLSKYGLQLKGDNIPTSGLLGELSWGAIANSKELPLNYDANIAPQKNNLTDMIIANVVFTVGWYEATGSGEVEPPYEGEAPIEGEEYVSGNYSYVYGSYYDENGAIVDNKLSGWSVKIIDKTKTSYVQPLEEIKGEPVVSYAFLFREYANSTLILEGTWTNRNVTNMNQMFNGSRVNTLDISNFNTSNVEHMSSMFKDYQATTLDLSSFNTSNVRDMTNMFAGCTADTLDLSSFNTSNVTNMDSMFAGSKATTGYARTQADADKFNATEDKPAALNFIAKPVEGETYTEGNYKYLYKRMYHPNGGIFGNLIDGWSVAVVDKTKTNYVQPLEEIKGQPVTHYDGLFRNYANTKLVLDGVWANKNVTSMSNMFQDCKATALNIGSLDTRHVKSIHYMFAGCKVDVLDLSGFDTSNMTGIAGVFNGCQSTIGYAKTQADADKLNSTTFKPSTLNFIVKPTVINKIVKLEVV